MFYLDNNDRKWFSVLVIYDVESTKNRNKVIRIIESYGIRVQKSAYECYITSGILKDIKKRISAVIDPQTDSVRIYRLNADCFDVVHGECNPYRANIYII